MTDPEVPVEPTDPTISASEAFVKWAKANAFDLIRAVTHSGYKQTSTKYAEMGFLAGYEAGASVQTQLEKEKADD